ncbi:MAG: hypothetical protein OEV42_15210 [Deltaproteobacteria bacterium]|nr:hypothetical protein [Deltaproteobacteria bacterium]
MDLRIYLTLTIMLLQTVLVILQMKTALLSHRRRQPTGLMMSIRIRR